MKVRIELIAAWLEGYTTGISWPDAWETHGKPGGPWIHGGGMVPWHLTNDKELSRQYTEYCQLTRDVNDAWREGWNYGHEVKHGRLPGIEKVKVPPDYPEHLKASPR